MSEERPYQQCDRQPKKPFCDACPDHEACASGIPQRPYRPLRWLLALVTRKPCLHCGHPLTSHDAFPSPLGPGRCWRCVPTENGPSEGGTDG